MRIQSLIQQCICWLLIQTATVFSDSPCIVMLRGTCSAGKSSICKEVEIANSEWHVIDEDDLYIKRLVQAMALEFPEEFEAIKKVIAPQNQFSAIKRFEICFDPLADEESKIEAVHAIDKIRNCLGGSEGVVFRSQFHKELKDHMIEEIRQALSEGKNVLVDSWLFPTSESIGNYYQDHRIIEVLAYCPLSIATQFLEKRNEEALRTNNFYSKRFFKGLLSSYHKLYRLTKEHERALDQYKRDEIDLFFNKMSQCVTQSWEEIAVSPFSWREMTL